MSPHLPYGTCCGERSLVGEEASDQPVRVAEDGVVDATRGDECFPGESGPRRGEWHARDAALVPHLRGLQAPAPFRIAPDHLVHPDTGQTLGVVPDPAARRARRWPTVVWNASSSARSQSSESPGTSSHRGRLEVSALTHCAYCPTRSVPVSTASTMRTTWCSKHLARGSTISAAVPASFSNWQPWCRTNWPMLESLVP